MIQNSIVWKWDAVFKQVGNRTVYQSLVFIYFPFYNGFAKYCLKRIVFVQNGQFQKLFSTRYVICINTNFKSTLFKNENTNKDKKNRIGNVRINA